MSKEDKTKILFTSKPIFYIPIDLIEKEMHLEESKRIPFIDKKISIIYQKSQGATNKGGGSNENLL